jgi:transposase
MEKTDLTTKQLNAIFGLLEGKKVEEAARQASVSPGSIYNWLKQDNFRKHLDKKRAQIFDESLGMLKSASVKAVRVLVELLEEKDRNTRRLAAVKLIDFAIKAAELKDLEERISHLEEIANR